MIAKETSAIGRIRTYIEKTGEVPLAYDMRTAEAKSIYSLLQTDPFGAVRLAFLYGRAKGIRAERKCYHSTAKCAESEAQIGRLLERANARQLDLILRIVREIIG